MPPSHTASSRSPITWLLLLTMLALVTAPAFFGCGYALTKGVILIFQTNTLALESDIERDHRALAREFPGTPAYQYYEYRISTRQASLDAIGRFHSEVAFDCACVFTAASIAVLALLCWALTAPPMPRFLVELDATPAGEDRRDLVQVVEALAARAALPPPKLYIVNTGLPNAFAGWTGPADTAIGLTRGAIALLEPREIAALLARQIASLTHQDIALSATLAALSLVLHAPVRAIRAIFSGPVDHGSRSLYGTWMHARTRIWVRILALAFVLSPVGLYVCIVAPLLAAAIRWAIMREGDLIADSEAAAITSDPEALVLALGKIRAVGSLGNTLAPAYSLLAFADPANGASPDDAWVRPLRASIDERIRALAPFLSRDAADRLRQAIEAGRRFAAAYPVPDNPSFNDTSHLDAVALANRGQIGGRVFRVLSMTEVPVFEKRGDKLHVTASVKPGAFIIVYDGIGLKGMRQINTANQVFGHLQRSVRLQRIDNMLPDEIYNPELIRAAEERLARQAEAIAGAPSQSRRYVGLSLACFAVLLITAIAGIWSYGHAVSQLPSEPTAREDAWPGMRPGNEFRPLTEIPGLPKPKPRKFFEFPRYTPVTELPVQKKDENKQSH